MTTWTTVQDSPIYGELFRQVVIRLFMVFFKNIILFILKMHTLEKSSEYLSTEF